MTPGSFAQFLLWMGDSGLATPVAAVVVVALAMSKATRALACRWAAAFLLVVALVLATKLQLFGWGNGIASIGFRGPSGHATLAAFVWPMVAWLITARGGRWIRVMGICLGAACAAGVAWVLVAYGFHSLVETVAGGLLGGAGAGVCIFTARSAHPPSARASWLAACAVAVVFGLQHGAPLRPLKQLERAAHRMVAST